MGATSDPSDGLDGADQTLIRQLHPGVLARPAESVDFESPPHRLKTEIGADAVFDPIQFVALELGHGPALDAHEMLMNRAVRESVLVPLEPFAEVVLLDESAADQEIEGAIDGRFSDPIASLSKHPLDVIDGQMTVGVEDDFCNRLALMRDR
jgi:hypothetical protein